MTTYWFKNRLTGEVVFYWKGCYCEADCRRKYSLSDEEWEYLYSENDEY